MKKINSIYIVLVSIVLIASTKATAQISKAEIRATGLTCSMCSNAINKQLKSLPEVVDVETDLNTNTFTVKLKEDNTLSPKVFKDRVEKALISVGEKDIQEMIDDGETIELSCHFCDLKYHFSIDELLSFYMGKNTPDRQKFIIDNLKVELDRIDS